MMNRILSRQLLTRAALIGTLAVFALVALGPTGARGGSTITPRPATTASQTGIIDNQKRVCVYDHNYISGLAVFASLTARKTIDCAMVYTGSPDWAGWVNPWFLHHPYADLNWAAWVRASPAADRRQLIISQPLIPSYLEGTDWLDAGAAGQYTGYAKQFAQNLVADGVGDAVIRLSWEMNGTWNIDNIGNSPSSYAKWVSFWRQTVFAMRSVPGAHFVFDWCPNNAYRNIPLASYYPGNDVVDIIGDDTYDTGIPAHVTDRWAYVYDGPSSLSAISAFAQANNKPLSLPEWGVASNDPAYIANIANLVNTNDVAFQTYFYNYGFAAELQHGRRNLAAYRAAFGGHGYADGLKHGTDIKPVHRKARRESASRRADLEQPRLCFRRLNRCLPVASADGAPGNGLGSDLR